MVSKTCKFTAERCNLAPYGLNIEDSANFEVSLEPGALPTYHPPSVSATVIFRARSSASSDCACRSALFRSELTFTSV